MSVHYKFKSTLQFDTITFDGLHISVGDLKREIIHQKRLGKLTDFDLQITNAQTKEEYQNDSYLIPKNTTLIISRIPVAQQTKKGWEKQTESSLITLNAPKHETTNMDLFKMQGSEEDKIQAMMLQSTADYDPKTYHRIKGQSQIGEVPASYRCNKCKKGGHWIKNCPYNIGKEHMDLKRNTGIPRSFRDKPEIPVEPESKESIVVKEIPEDLICGICNDLFVDAVMIPCCGSSFCDDCVRTALLESEDNECPDCKEMGCSPGSLIPNRFLRNSVNAFKNETGYNTTLKSTTKPPEAAETSEKTLQSNTEDTSTKSSVVEEDKSDKKKLEESPKPTSVEKNEPSKENLIETSDHSHEEKAPVKLPEVKTNTPKSINDEHTSNGQATQNPQPPGIESSPAKMKLSSPQQSQIDGNGLPSRLEKESDKFKNQSDISPPKNIKIHNECEIPSIQNVQPNNNLNTHSDRLNKQLENMEQQNRGQRINVYKPIMYHQLPPRGHDIHMQHAMPSYNNGYNEMPAQRPPIDYRMYPNQHHHLNNIRPSYAHGNQNLPSAQHFPNSNLASIYQGVAAKVGTGVIDDPLEAFNRIMKEKEKQKEERRRSPERRRSRSMDRQPKSRFRSPHYDRRPEREPPSRDKRPRSRENRKEPMPERKHKYSNRGSLSPNDKRIRSMKYRSPSPKVGYRYSTNEKPVSKVNFSKMESFEPPPPGFESIPTIQRESELKNSNRYGRSHTPNINEKGFTRVTKDEHTSISNTQHRRESRGVSKGAEKRNVNERTHSTTPKPKIMKSSREEVTDINIVLNKSETNVLNERQGKNCFKLEEFQKNDNNKYVELQPESISKEPLHLERRSESKDERSSREHKKKKKIKTDRKKNKKDKKEKRDKSRKNSTPDLKTTPLIHNEGSPLSPNVKDNKLNQFEDDLLAIPTRSDWENVGNSNNKRHRTDDKVTAPSSDHSKKRRTSENSPTVEFKRFDSVLDLEAYDTDLDGAGCGQSSDKQKNSQISKWECDEHNFNLNERETSGKENTEQIDEHSLITSDVLRKAESAIFTKAINAIRPVEFKITIPMESRSQERAVSIKRDGDESLSPKLHKSIKDRLGSKVVQRKERSPLNVRSSKDKKRSVEPKRIVERRNSRREKDSRPRSQNRRDQQRSRNNNNTYNKRDRERDRDERRNSNDVNHDSQKSKRDSSKNDNDRGRDLVRDHGHGFKDKRDQSRGKTGNYDDHHAEKKLPNVLKSNFCPTVASVASKPSRHDNPFRKFERVDTIKLPKYNRSDSTDSQINDDDEKQKKRRKEKKLKKRSKCSSTETLNSEKIKDNKKKKPKSTKKKKKSKK